MSHEGPAPLPATTYIALLRGINVGRARQVAVDELRGIVASRGYRDVRTLLRSGNVVFTGPRQPPRDVAATRGRAIATQLALRVGIVVRTSAELADVVAANPLPEAVNDRTFLHVLFLAQPLTAGEGALLDPEQFLPDVVRCSEREIYVWYRHGMSGSRTAEQLDRRLETLATDRNWNTVTKLQALATGT